MSDPTWLIELNTTLTSWPFSSGYEEKYIKRLHSEIIKLNEEVMCLDDKGVWESWQHGNACGELRTKRLLMADMLCGDFKYMYE